MVFRFRRLEEALAYIVLFVNIHLIFKRWPVIPTLRDFNPCVAASFINTLT